MLWLIGFRKRVKCLGIRGVLGLVSRVQGRMVGVAVLGRDLWRRALIQDLAFSDYCFEVRVSAQDSHLPLSS